MTIDEKLPRWVTYPLFALWSMSLVLGMVAQSVNIAANLHYLQSESGKPPPPFPGKIERRDETPEQPKEQPQRRIRRNAQ